MNPTRLYTLPYSEARTYLFASLFVLGNILLPQTCHFFALGGKIWLPIYFFTLIGAYKYGWKVGLLTALASPLINSAAFGMPVTGMLPIVLTKSVLLALASGLTAQYQRCVTLLSLAGVVLTYQALGTLAEWGLTGSWHVALADLRLGLPGMALQVVGGYFVLKFINK